MTVDQFVKKYQGKKLDWDKAYQGQCVDLFRYYVHEVLQLSQPRGVVGAADFWTNYQSDPILRDNFEKIPNTPEFVPKKGDVVIWNKKAGGGFGHIAVFIEGGVMNFTSFDQNWRALNVSELTKHDYKNVYGVLRPKGKSMSKELEECLAQHKKLVDEANQKDKELRGLEEEIEMLERQVKTLKKDHKAFEVSVAEQLAAKDKQISAYKGEVTKKETKIAELEAALEEATNAKASTWERFTSRKFIVALLALIVPIANQQLGWELNASEILALLTPLLAFMGIEGFTDHKQRMEATKSLVEVKKD